jgi:hypothetical protein
VLKIIFGAPSLAYLSFKGSSLSAKFKGEKAQISKGPCPCIIPRLKLSVLIGICQLYINTYAHIHAQPTKRSFSNLGRQDNLGAFNWVIVLPRYTKIKCKNSGLIF